MTRKTTAPAPLPRPRLTCPAPMSMGLTIAIASTNPFIATSTDVELSESGDFLLVGKWPENLEAIGNFFPCSFSVVANSDGVVTGVEVSGASKSDWIGVELVNSRTLSALLNAWTDEQIAKSSPGLFREKSQAI